MSLKDTPLFSSPSFSHSVLKPLRGAEQPSVSFLSLSWQIPSHAVAQNHTVPYLAVPEHRRVRWLSPGPQQGVSRTAFLSHSSKGKSTPSSFRLRGAARAPVSGSRPPSYPAVPGRARLPLPSLWFSLLPSARAWREPRGWAAFPRRPRSPPLGASPGYYRLQRSASTSLGFHLPPQGTVPAGHRGVCWWPPDKRHPECRNPGRARGRSHDGWRGCARVQPAGTQQPEGVPHGAALPVTALWAQEESHTPPPHTQPTWGVRARGEGTTGP